MHGISSFHRSLRGQFSRSGSRPWLLVILCLFLGETAEARVDAFVEKQDIYLNESVSFVIESNVPGSAAPDLSALENDFAITVGNTSTQTKLINGVQFSLTRWTYLLKPKRVGDITIPSVTNKGETTEPITISVSPVPDDVAKEIASHAVLEVEVENDNLEPYVQEQVLVSVRLVYDDTITSGNIDELTVDNAVVEAFRDEKQYTTERDGRTFRVFEQRYIVSPEKSGEIIIPPLKFNGTMVGDRKPKDRARSTFEERVRRMLRGTPMENDPFFMENNFELDLRSRGREIQIASKELRLNVRPRPSSAGGSSWLPAEEVTIVDSWAEEPPDPRAGEPLSRTVLLTMKGLVASQIPELEIKKPQGARMYLDAPYADTPTDSQSINGRRQQTITYIPDAAGKLIIPPIRIDWWDVVEDQPRTTEIDAITLDVIPGANAPRQTEASANPVSVPKTTTAETESAVDSGNDGAQDVEARTTSQGASQSMAEGRSAWILTVAGIVVGGLLLAVASWWFGRNGANLRRPPSQSKRITASLQQLKQACNEADPQRAHLSVLDLARLRWPDSHFSGLTGIARRLEENSQSGEGLIALEQHLFAPSPDHRAWSPDSMKPLLRKEAWVAKSKVTKTPAYPLNPLYPTRQSV